MAVRSPVASGGAGEAPRTGGARIRPAVAADLAIVTTIEEASFSDPWSAASFRALLGNPNVLFWVASAEDSSVLGYIVMWLALDEAEVANLAVAPAARGRHLGAALLDAALESAAARGVACVYLEVRSSNEVARQLYVSRGFEEVGRRRNYYRRPLEDALIMRCMVGGSERVARTAQR